MKPKTRVKPTSVRIVLNPPTLDFLEVSDLMASVGMRPRKMPQMRRAVEASSDVVVAYYGRELAGFGRMISDKVYYGTIWDVAVRPNLQRRGIGTQIMRALMRRTKSRKLYMVGLFTARHNRAFYESLGFDFFDDTHAMTYIA